MNPLNLLLSLAIAKNKEIEYQVSDSQSLQNTALLSGVISTNPILSYFLIDNKAKQLQNTIVVNTAKTLASPAPKEIPIITPNVIPVILPKEDTASKEILKRLEEIKSEIVTTITQNIDKSILDKIDERFIKSNNPKIIELQEATKHYFSTEAINSLTNLNEDFVFISNKDNIAKLSKEDLRTIEKLKVDFFDKNYIDESIKIFKSETSENFYLDYFTINLSIQNKVSEIKYKLKNSIVTAKINEPKITEPKIEIQKTDFSKKEPLKK